MESMVGCKVPVISWLAAVHWAFEEWHMALWWRCRGLFIYCIYYLLPLFSWSGLGLVRESGGRKNAWEMWSTLALLQTLSHKRGTWTQKEKCGKPRAHCVNCASCFIYELLAQLPTINVLESKQERSSHNKTFSLRMWCEGREFSS